MNQDRPADDLRRFCCLNTACTDYGKRGAGNLTVPMRYGNPPRRVLRCRTCKARFSDGPTAPRRGCRPTTFPRLRRPADGLRQLVVKSVQRPPHRKSFDTSACFDR
jgi:hypothetical protein